MRRALCCTQCGDPGSVHLHCSKGPLQASAPVSGTSFSSSFSADDWAFLYIKKGGACVGVWQVKLLARDVGSGLGIGYLTVFCCLLMAWEISEGYQECLGPYDHWEAG